MAASNADVARVFDEIADLLEIEGENAFRIRAYRNAARTVDGLGESVADMIERSEDLTELPGIGKDLAAKIGEIVASGSCAALEELRGKLPPTITTLLKIPGLGPKRVQALYRNLDIATAEQLLAAAREGKIHDLPGFGEKTETLILRSLQHDVEGGGARFQLAVAAQYAEGLRAYLAQTPGVGEVIVAGSYRRAKESVGDLDIVVTARSSKAAMQRFCEYPEVARIVGQGGTRATIVLGNGLQVDMRVVPRTSFGAALYYFTGSKTHNIAVRRIAQQRGLKVNEYGVFRGRRRIAGDTEESVFRAIGLPPIPPELRENRGEIEAAQAGKLPHLVALDEIQGDLHVNVDEAASNLNALIDAARARKLRYLAVAVHARHGEKRMHACRERIEKIGRASADVRLLNAVEVDIRETGELDAPEASLAQFDVVIAALNDQFNLPRARQTERVLRALAHPEVTMLARPSGRRVDQPPRIEVDMPQIVRAAREHNCLLELDARPEFLDLPDIYCRLAKDEGARVAICSDARSAEDFAYLAHGVGQARRGWLEPKDVVNTRPTKELIALLKRAR